MDLLSRAFRAYRERGITYVSIAGLRLLLRNIERYMIKQTRLSYPYYARKYERNAVGAMQALSNKGIGPTIHNLSLDKHKSSNTIFILGSGSSINDITSSMWQHIDSHDSMGLNRWPVHDFVPTFHIFEMKVRSDYANYNRDYWKMLSLRSEDYDNTPIILKNTMGSAQKLSRERIPEKLVGEIILSADTSYSELTYGSDPIKLNKRLLAYLKRTGRFEPGNGYPIYRKRASISYLIHLAVKLGYQRIVLCGVDMVDSEYFFEENKNYYKDKTCPIPKHESDDKEGEHKTNDPDYGELTLEKVIYQMNDIVLKPSGIELFVENTKSALHPEVPLYSPD